MKKGTATFKTKLAKILGLPSGTAESKLLKAVAKLAAESKFETRLEAYMKATNQSREIAIKSLAEQDAVSACKK